MKVVSSGCGVPGEGRSSRQSNLRTAVISTDFTDKDTDINETGTYKLASLQAIKHN